MDLLLLLVPLGFVVCFIILWITGNHKISLKSILIGISFVIFILLCVRIGVNLGENNSTDPVDEPVITPETITKEHPLSIPEEAPKNIEERISETLPEHNDHESLEFRNDFEKYMALHNDQTAKEDEKYKAWQNFCRKWKVPLNLGGSLNTAFEIKENFEQNSIADWKLQAFIKTGREVPDESKNQVDVKYHSTERGGVLELRLTSRIIMVLAETKPIPYDHTMQYQLSALAKSTGPTARIHITGYQLAQNVPPNTEPSFDNLKEVYRSDTINFENTSKSKKYLPDWSPGTAQYPGKKRAKEIQFLTVKIIAHGKPGALLIDNIILQPTRMINTK